MSNLRDSYDRLPDDAKDAIWRELEQALLWRSWDRAGILPGSHAREAIEKIADVFSCNGREMPVYT